MIDKKVVAILCFNNRQFAHTGVITDIKKRWFGKTIYIIDGKYRSKQVIRILED